VEIVVRTNYVFIYRFSRYTDGTHVSGKLFIGRILLHTMYHQLHQYPMEQILYTSHRKVMEADVTVLKSGCGYGREGLFDSE
jgi:hypothetical protein